jgi:ankyrin repeat protein
MAVGMSAGTEDVKPHEIIILDQQHHPGMTPSSASSDYLPIPEEVVMEILKACNYKVALPEIVLACASANNLVSLDLFRALISGNVKWWKRSFRELLIQLFNMYDPELESSDVETGKTSLDSNCIFKSLMTIKIYPECSPIIIYGSARLRYSVLTYLNQIDLSLNQVRSGLTQSVPESLRAEPACENAMQCFAYNGDPAYMRELIEYDPPLCTKEDITNFDLLPIVISSQHGDLQSYLELANILIDYNPAALLKEDENGNLPIHIACAIQDANLGLGIIKILVQKGIKHNFKDGKGGLLIPDQDGEDGLEILLRHAFRHHELACDVISYLFGTESPLFELNYMATYQILHKAVQFNNNIPAVKLLLELNPAVLLQKNELGNLPIYSTVTMYPQLSSTRDLSPVTMCNEIIKPNMLTLLIQEHTKNDTISLMAKNKDGMTVLDVILAYLFVVDKSEVIQEDFPRFDFKMTFDMIWQSLDTVFQNYSPQANMVHAALNAGIRGERLLEIMNRYGPLSTCSTTDSEGRYPLHLAIEKRIDWNEGLSAILDANSNVLSLRDKNEHLPLHIAIGNKCTKTIAALTLRGLSFIRHKEFHTRLYPFAFAATKECEINSIYILLRDCPELLVVKRGSLKRTFDEI